VRLLGSLAAALVAMAMIAGCGGGDESASGAQSLSRAEFVHQANALCRQERIGLAKEAAELVRRELSRGFSHDVALHEAAHYVLLPAIENEISKIRFLAIPPADRPGVEAALSAERSAVDRIAVPNTLASMAAFHHEFTESAVELRVNGLDDCANDR
jgi:hypothetical protein